MMENNYSIRGFESEDLQQLSEIWFAPHNLDEAEGRLLLQESSEIPFTRSVTAVKEGLAFAAAAAAQSSLHPEYLWGYIEVEPGQRQQGVGTALLQELEQQVQEYLTESFAVQFKGLRAKVPAAAKNQGVTAEDAGEAFAHASDFTLVQLIKTFRVFPGALSTIEAVQNQEIVVEELATGSVELTRAIWNFYRKAHAWGRPADVSLGRVQRLFLGPDSGAYGALVVRNSNRDILAFAISYVIAPASTVAANENLSPLQDGSDNVEPEAQKATRVMIGYNSSYAEEIHGQERNEVGEALRSLISLLVHRDPIELEVPEAATVLYGMLDSLADEGSDLVAVTACDKIFLKKWGT